MNIAAAGECSAYVFKTMQFVAIEVLIIITGFQAINQSKWSDLQAKKHSNNFFMSSWLQKIFKKNFSCNRNAYPSNCFLP